LEKEEIGSDETNEKKRSAPFAEIAMDLKKQGPPYAGRKFDPGDLVRCIDCDHEFCSDDYPYPRNIYRVSEWINDPINPKIRVTEFVESFDASQFEFVEPGKPQCGSDPRGFWLVKGEGPSTFEHFTLEDAEKEAQRLAMSNPGSTFTVLGPVCSYVTSEFQRHDLTKIAEAGEDLDRSIPF